MAFQLTPANLARRSLQTRHVYVASALCLVVGLGAGYAVRALRVPANPTARAVAASAPFTHSGAAQRPSLQQLQQMAATQAAPLLEKLKTDPNNPALLVEVGALYHATHQFDRAALYYRRAVDADPNNVALRSKLASSLYRGGDVDGAIAQLNQALSYDAKDANALFNLGMIEWQGKQDAPAALAAWKHLLKSNPQLSPDRKATVQKLMAQAQTAAPSASRNGSQY